MQHRQPLEPVAGTRRLSDFCKLCCRLRLPLLLQLVCIENLLLRSLAATGMARDRVGAEVGDGGRRRSQGKRFMALQQLLPTVNAAANKSIEFISFINCLSNGQQQQQQRQPSQVKPTAGSCNFFLFFFKQATPQVSIGLLHVASGNASLVVATRLIECTRVAKTNH